MSEAFYVDVDDSVAKAKTQIRASANCAVQTYPESQNTWKPAVLNLIPLCRRDPSLKKEREEN